jgi:hypothetical protein
MKKTKNIIAKKVRLFIFSIKIYFISKYLDYQNVDYQILEKYSEKNKHFYFNQILYNNDQQIIGYEFVYRYENYQVKLEFYLSDGIWDIDAQQFNRKQQQILKILLDDMDNTTNMSLEQQIQIIIQRFDHHFYG